MRSQSNDSLSVRFHAFPVCSRVFPVFPKSPAKDKTVSCCVLQALQGARRLLKTAVATGQAQAGVEQIYL